MFPRMKKCEKEQEGYVSSVPGYSYGVPFWITDLDY
jgi:hypothetical protein